MDINKLTENLSEFENLIVKLVSEKLEEIKKQIEDIKNPENKIFLRNEKGGDYYYIVITKFGMKIYSTKECNIEEDDKRFENNNYFIVEKRAWEVADKIDFHLRLERFKDEFCPNYAPNWNNENECKYSVEFDYNANEYCVNTHKYLEAKGNVYFSTRAITQRVCDILNKEQKSNNQ